MYIERTVQGTSTEEKDTERKESPTTEEKYIESKDTHYRGEKLPHHRGKQIKGVRQGLSGGWGGGR